MTRMRINNIGNKNNKAKVPRKAINLTISNKARTRLDTLARQNHQSKSRMVEILIFNAYENKCDFSPQLIRSKIDELNNK